MTMQWWQRLRKTEWEYVVNRDEALLFRSLTTGAFRSFPQATGIPWRSQFILRPDDGRYYHAAGELERLRSWLARQRVTFYRGFRLRLLRAMRQLDSVARELERIEYSKLSRRKLVRLVDRYYRAATVAHNFLAVMPIIGRDVERSIMNALPAASESHQRQWLYTLTYPTKENEPTREARAFYKLASQRRRKNFDRLVAAHLLRYGWIGARWFWWPKAWTAQDVRARLAEFSTQRRSSRRELQHLDALRHQQHQQAQQLMRTFGISPTSSVGQLIALARAYAYLRTYRTDVIYRSSYRVRNLFYEIARRVGFRQEHDILYCLYAEARQMAAADRRSVAASEIARRKQYYLLCLERGQMRLVSGRVWQQRMRGVPSVGRQPTTSVRGTVAFRGKVIGRVAVVRSVDDLAKVRRHAILVAVMTFPSFIAAMERAAAFVTDEGGILCPAAIVSRELRKPCVIGTKVATQVLKDGDRVEVDANTGVVRKLP